MHLSRILVFGLFRIRPKTNQPKVNYENRMKSFLTDGNCESTMEKTIALPGVQWNVFHCIL